MLGFYWQSTSVSAHAERVSEKLPIFAQPKLSITQIIAFSSLLITSRALNHSIYRYIGVAVSVQSAKLSLSRYPTVRSVAKRTEQYKELTEYAQLD